jgi:replicative DNA helicase
MTTQLHDAETEKAILGCFLIDQALIDTIGLEPDVFYFIRNRVIFETMYKMHKSGTQIDNITLGAEINKLGKLAEFGGDAYITELISCGTLSYNSESYAAILAEKRNRRRLIEIAEMLAKAANDEKKQISDCIPGAINNLSNIETKKDNSTITIQQLMSEALDDIDYRIAHPSDIWGIETGYPQFDFVTGGLQLGEIFILSGLPGKGKSMWAMQAGLQMGAKNYGVIYSIEMRRLAVARRWISGKSGVDARVLKSGRIVDGQYSKIISTVDHIAANTELLMCDEPRMKLHDLRSRIAKAKQNYGIKWMIIDYLYLLDAGTNDDTEKTNIISQELKLICREFDIAGIVIHSMNQAGMKNMEDGKDNLHGALRGSAQTEYTGDLIAFLRDYDPSKDKKSFMIKEADRENMRDLVFGKGRELSNPKQFVRYVKNPNFPYFAEHQE